MFPMIGEYELHSCLGSGCSSEVWAAVHDKRNVALKCIYLNDLTGKNRQNMNLFYNEAKILSKLTHPNILALYESNNMEILKKIDGEEVPIVYLSLELANNGKLSNCISISEPLTEALARHYFKSLVSAVEYVHNNGYFHGDIKLENLLLNSNYELKLADFGFCTSIDHPKLNPEVAEVEYAAPEINTKVYYSGIKSDIFAVGLSLLIMVAGYKPFRKASLHDEIYGIMCKDSDKFWHIVEEKINKKRKKHRKKLSKEVMDLVNKLIAYKPEMRPSIEEIKSHPWYKRSNMTETEVKEEMYTKKEKLCAEIDTSISKDNEK